MKLRLPKLDQARDVRQAQHLTALTEILRSDKDRTKPFCINATKNSEQTGKSVTTPGGGQSDS